jgi:hypothetical protein
MSERYNTAFLKNPDKFASKHVMACGAKPGYDLKIHTHYLSVPSDKRICFWDIEEEYLDTTDGICNVSISTDYINKYKVGYYLPYKSNSVIKCTLKDKRDNKTKFIYGEPEAFFTYVIDGCSIIIEGSLTQPTVYHANNSNSSPSQRALVALDLTRKWKSTNLPKLSQNYLERSPRNTVRFKGIALHATEYLSDEQVYLQKFQDDFVLVKVYGLVFGVCKNGLWEFYLQKNLKRIGNSGKIYNVLSVQKFWPGSGLGQVVLRPPYLTSQGFRLHMEQEGERAIGNQRVFNSITEDML